MAVERADAVDLPAARIEASFAAVAALSAVRCVSSDVPRDIIYGEEEGILQ